MVNTALPKKVKKYTAALSVIQKANFKLLGVGGGWWDLIAGSMHRSGDTVDNTREELAYSCF